MARDQNRVLSARFVRFVLVGMVNTGFGYGIYALFVLAGFHPQVALILQFVIGSLWNYSLHARLVFDRQGYDRLPLYLGSYVMIWAVNAGLLRAALGAGLTPLLAQMLILPLTVILSFVLISRVLCPPQKGAIG